VVLTAPPNESPLPYCRAIHAKPEDATRSHLVNTEGVAVSKIQMLVVAVALSAVALLVAVYADASSAAHQKVARRTLVSIHKTNLGRVLADGRGHTLCLFEKDTRGTSSCYGACVAYWPAVFSRVKPRAGAGVDASLLGLTRRADGRRQVIYAGHPLYAFIGDTKPAQTAGEGLTDVGATWEAIASNGRSIEPKAPAAGGSGNGYGRGW
jgi:predicted lipoprotein with Yx(FWY)xxD motif